MHTYAHTYIHTYIHTYTCTYMDIYKHTYRQTDRKTNAHAMHTCILNMDTCRHSYMLASIYKHIHIHTNIHTEDTHLQVGMHACM